MIFHARLRLSKRPIRRYTWSELPKDRRSRHNQTMHHTTIIGLLTLELELPGVSSLKEKRGILKFLISRVQKQFNVSVAEVGYNDVWQSSAIAIATVTNSTRHANQVVDTVLKWIEQNFPDLEIIGERIEII